MSKNTKYKKTYRRGKKILKGKHPILLALLFITIAGWYAYDTWQTHHKTLESDQVILASCTDGDTAHFVIEGKDTKVRFLAIDTPESGAPNTPEPYGEEAKQYTCNALTNAKTIRLEYEESHQSDKYGRTLAWVFVDDVLLQKSLVQEGLAEVAYIYGEYVYTPQLQAAQKEAQKTKRGIWKES